MFLSKSFDVNHPNPQFYRNTYINLNGTWDFKLDYLSMYNYKNGIKNPLTINVPYCYMEEKSGINIKKRCDTVWYFKEIDINSLEKDIILHLEGSDYETILYVNGMYVDKRFGGYNRHSFLITKFLKIGKNKIVLKIKDNKSVFKPRGKQRFTINNIGCWYEETTGIYKDVWIEFVPKKRIEYFKFIPSFKNKNIKVVLSANTKIENLNFKISYKGNKIIDNIYNSDNEKIEFTVDLSNNFHPWDVLKPEIYDVEFNLKEDTVLSYFGIRDIYINNNKIFLNDHEIYQKLILDQGYIEGGGLTLTKEELLNDINTMIEMGFNGARKHQKREADIFYSYADFLGYLVWLEMPSFYLFNKISSNRMKMEWSKIVKELINHPSIISYTPFNESWGIFGIDKGKKKVVNFVNSVYDLTKEIDGTRLIQTNDGWSHSKSDFLTIHNYNQNPIEFEKIINNAIKNNYVPFMKGRKLALDGNIQNKPILVDEFGGTSFINKDSKTWGYGNNVKDIDEYKNRLNSLFNTILKNERICGYCYTQLSDVRQEMNGLLKMNRDFKISPKDMKEIQNS